MANRIRGPITGTVTNNGDLIIKGEVAPGAEITVTNGSLKIEGNVGDNAVLIQKAASSGHNFNSSPDGSIQHHSFGKNSANIISNGDVIIRMGDDDGGVTIDMRSSASKHTGITVTGDVGKGVRVETDGTFTSNSIGEGASITAGNDIKAALVQARAILNSGHQIKISDCSDSSATLTAPGKTTSKTCGLQ